MKLPRTVRPAVLASACSSTPQIMRQAVLVIPLVVSPLASSVKRDAQARRTARPWRAARAAVCGSRIFGVSKYFGSGQKRTVVPVFFLPHLADRLRASTATVAMLEVSCGIPCRRGGPDSTRFLTARSPPKRRRRASRRRTGSSCSENLPPACRRVRISSTPGTFSRGECPPACRGRRR